MFWKLVPVYFLRCSRVDLLPYPSLLSLMGLELDFIYVVSFLVTIAITIIALLIIYLCHVLLIFNNEHFLRASHFIFCFQSPKTPNNAKLWSYYMICFSSFTILFFKKVLCWKQYSGFFFFLIGITFLILKITVVSIGSVFPY